MGDILLPKGWVLAPIAQLISIDGLISDGDWVESKDQDINGSVRLIQLADVGDGYFQNKSNRFMSIEKAKALNCTFLKQGDLLIARMPAPLGRTCIFPEIGQKSVTVVDICIIRTSNNSAITNSVLTYWLNSPFMRNEIEVNSSGTTRKRITRKKLEQFVIPLPPMPEQKIIAEKLDLLLAQVQETKSRLEQIPELLKQFRQSVLSDAVSGKLTGEWRESKNLNDWKNGKLKDFIKKPSYGTSTKSKKVGSVPVLRMGNLKNGNLDWTDLVYTSDQTEIDKYELIAGDVLFNRTNSPELVGKTSIYRGERKAIYAGYLIKIQCLDDLIPEYLNYNLNSPEAKQYCYEVKSDGVSQSNINAQKLGEYPIQIPSLEEQNEIVRRVEQLFAYADKIEQQVNIALEKVNHLPQSILAKAFRGELTAQWRTKNPDLITGENSAASLLEKIQVEREQNNKNKKKK